MNIKHGFIYKATNLINGKVYIGMTTQAKPQHRWAEHLGKARSLVQSKSYFHHAIAKYGEENFKFEILEEGITSFEELQQLEIAYIAEYESFGKGYNLTTGGEGGKREGTSIVQLDKDTGEYIDEFYSIVQACDELDINYGTLSSHLAGVTHTTNGFIFEYKDLYEAEDYKFQPVEFKSSPRVVQLDKITGELLGRYNSFIDASRATRVSAATIARMINDGSIADEFVWMMETEYDSEDFVFNPEDYVTHGVVQLDKDTGELINKYYSIKEAAEAHGIAISNISSSFKRRNYAAGYIWIPLEEYNNGYIFDRYNHLSTIPVVQLDKNTGECIATYDSGEEAVKAIGKGGASHISAVCKGKRHTTGGYKWMYYAEYINKVNPVTE